MPTKKWIQDVKPKTGSLHLQLGIPQAEKIPKKLLHDIEKTAIGKSSHGVTVTPLVKHRVTFALNAQKRRK